MEKTTTSSRHGQRSAESQERLILAAQGLILRQGFAATTVDQICAEAGLTKGAFFHHFANKEAIGRAALDAWGAMGTRLYSAAWSDPTLDPLAQLHRMFDIMISFTQREEPCTCVVGMLSQELAQSHPELAAVCARHLDDWTEHVVRLLEGAKQTHPAHMPFDSRRMAWLLNAIWQGSMLIAKTRRTPALIVSNIQLARTHVDALFHAAPAPAAPPPPPSRETAP
jgi:TetR/AcrR family transcriptional regulator, transcriptional repressor for nem operon